MIDKSLNYGRHFIKKFSQDVKPGAIVIDLGAGYGNDLLIIKENIPNAKLHAVENFPPYVEDLRAKGITVHDKNIERDILPFSDNTVDLVIGNQIIEHCKEIWWIFHEINRVLKVGGSAIIGVPNLASLHNRFLLLIGNQPTSIHNHKAHVRGYTKNDLCKFISEGSENALELTDFGGSNFYPLPPVLAQPLAKILPTMSVGIFFKFEKKKEYSGSFLKYPIETKLETNFHLG